LVLEQLGGRQREQIRSYREYVESARNGGARDEPPPTIKQVIIGDTEFAEQVFNKRPVRVAIATHAEFVIPRKRQTVPVVPSLTAVQSSRVQSFKVLFQSI
jgi:hypothetical protein